MNTLVLTNPMIEDLWERFAESKEYRDNFVAAFVKKSIPSQIRAWMKKQGISTQQELAKRSGITQGVISRAANPNYGDLALNTVIKIGSGFDCVFVGKYVPYSEFCKMVVEGSFAEDADSMRSFEEENAEFEMSMREQEMEPSKIESNNEFALAMNELFHREEAKNLDPARQNRPKSEPKKSDKENTPKLEKKPPQSEPEYSEQAIFGKRQRGTR